MRSRASRCSRKWEAWTSSTDSSAHGHGSRTSMTCFTFPSKDKMSMPSKPSRGFGPQPMSSLRGAAGGAIARPLVMGSPSDSGAGVKVADTDGTVDGAAVPVLPEISPCVQILSRDAASALGRDEPRLPEVLVLEHGHAPEVEAHAGPAALDESARRVRRLRTEVENWVLRIAPDLRAAPLALREVEAADAVELGMLFHVLKEFE